MGLDISRIGNISTLDLEKGTAKVHYADTGNTTSDMPLFRFGDEFNPPNVGDQVIVIHLSNDSSSGVILGKFWDETEPPKIKQGYRFQSTRLSRASTAKLSKPAPHPP